MQHYLDLLNEEQRAAVEHEGSPLLILAAAGSGKTRVITTKIAYLISQKNIEPWQILSVTFTKKAANEMRRRAVEIEQRAADAQIRTFHSFGSWFLRKYSDECGLVPSFTIYDDDDMAVLLKKAVPSLSTKEVKAAAHQISLAKDYCLTPEDDLSILGSEFDINDIYREYQKRLRATGNVDFGDLIMLTGQIMHDNHKISKYIHSRFRVIMVDEYQDSNIAQYKLLQELSGVQHGNDSYVCVVGDDDQSIYKFRGAEVENIVTFPEKFPGTQIIKLIRNYRSTAKILNAAGLVVKKNKNRLGKELIAERGDGGSPVLAFLSDQNAETGFVSDLIKKSVASGAKYSDWAVLYRTNAQSLGFEKEFIHKKIPYVVVGSLKFYEREEIKDALAYLSLFANKKDEISFRRIINKPSRSIGEKTQDKIVESAVSANQSGERSLSNLVEAVRSISQSLSKKAHEGAEAFVKLYDEIASEFYFFDRSTDAQNADIDQNSDIEQNVDIEQNADARNSAIISDTKSGSNAENYSLSKFIERVIHDSGLGEYHRAGDDIDGTTRVQNLEELVNSAVPYECSMEGLLEFLDAINLDRSLEIESEDAGDNAVTLITLHNTKGLEYNKVIITGLEEGIFPRAEKVGSELEEERRLFYVGITRARDELYVTSTRQRFMYGRLEYMKPSLFIRESSEAFYIVGSKPFGFSRLSDGYSAGYGVKEDELSEKWKKGTKVFHDDYGYGAIVSASSNSGEFVIDVMFETGGRKKFLPKYQAKSLEIVKD